MGAPMGGRSPCRILPCPPPCSPRPPISPRTGSTTRAWTSFVSRSTSSPRWRRAGRGRFGRCLAWTSAGGNLWVYGVEGEQRPLAASARVDRVASACHRRKNSDATRQGWTKPEEAELERAQAEARTQAQEEPDLAEAVRRPRDDTVAGPRDAPSHGGGEEGVRAATRPAQRTALRPSRLRSGPGGRAGAEGPVSGHAVGLAVGAVGHGARTMALGASGTGCRPLATIRTSGISSFPASDWPRLTSFAS